MNRRYFLFGIPLIASAVLRADTITILRCDAERFKDSLYLEKLLELDRSDMNIDLGHGLNLERVRTEDHLYAKIQSERGDCHHPF